MQVKATKRGFYKRMYLSGESFDCPDEIFSPKWMKKINGDKDMALHRKASLSKIQAFPNPSDRRLPSRRKGSRSAVPCETLSSKHVHGSRQIFTTVWYLMYYINRLTDRMEASSLLIFSSGCAIAWKRSQNTAIPTGRPFGTTGACDPPRVAHTGRQRYFASPVASARATPWDRSGALL